MQLLDNTEHVKIQRSALLILRTPFQAWIAKQVLLAESVSAYDLLYFTQNNSLEDRQYFNALSLNAAQSEYFYAPIRSFDIFGHLDFLRQARAWLCDRGLDLTLIASIDSYIPSAIANRQSGELVTFDDGSANFYAQSLYHLDLTGWRGRIYRQLFRSVDLSRIKQRIIRHYTLYPEFENIVEAKRLRTLSTSTWNSNERKYSEGPVSSYFIGQPFEQIMSPSQITTLESKLRGLKIDFYVQHPRETVPLDIDAELLDKGGLIAEEAILRNSGSGCVHILGWFSTVMFNTGILAKRRTMFLFVSDPSSSWMADLAQRSGCEIEWL